MDPVLSLQRVRLPARDRSVSQNHVVFDVYPGELLSIFGEEGSGKSALIKVMAGLLLPEDGSVMLDNRPMGQWSSRERVERLGVVFGNPDPFFLAARVWEEVAMGVANLDLAGVELNDRVDEALTQAGLPLSIKQDNIMDLAVSQRSRVALAATLACRPRLLLAEEPGVLLSDQGEVQLADTFRKVCRGFGMTLVTVTGRRQRAHRFGERVLCLEQGRVHTMDVASGSSQSGESTTCT